MPLTGRAELYVSSRLPDVPTFTSVVALYLPLQHDLLGCAAVSGRQPDEVDTTRDWLASFIASVPVRGAGAVGFQTTHQSSDSVTD